MSATRRAGSVTRRCECRGPDGRRLSQNCPQLTKRTHGTYQLRQELPPDADGHRRTFRRTGYATVTKANSELANVQAVLDLAQDDEVDLLRVGDFLADISRDRKPIPAPADVAKKLGLGVPLDGKMTVAQWLYRWLGRKKTRATTNASYRSHVEYHLKPRIGHYRLDRLSVGHLVAMFDAIADESDVIRAENLARREQEERCRWTLPGRPPASQLQRLKAEREKLAAMPPYRKANGPATRLAVRRTLRAALNAAISEQLITFNAAAHVELTAAPRPKGLLWTDERVARWRKTGVIPGPVMVWTPTHLGKFLDVAESHRLYAGYHMISHHGLRRGEGCGQSWEDTHLSAKPPRLDVLRELVVDGSTPIETAPKTDSSVAAVTIDRGTVTVLRVHKRRQNAERKAWNAEAAERRARGEEAHDWIETGKILTAEDGSWLHPDVLSREFVKLCEQADLPPINLRDLRHVAAALVKAGGGDIHDAKAKLRHANISLTSDTYMSLFEEYEEDLAERSAAAVPRASKRAPELEAAPEEAGDAVQDDEDDDAGESAA